MHFVCAWFHNGHHHNWFYFQSNVIVVEKDAFGVVFLLLYVLVWPCRLELIFIIWVFNNIIFGLNVKNIFFIKKCFQNSNMCCSSEKGVYGFARSCNGGKYIMLLWSHSPKGFKLCFTLHLGCFWSIFVFGSRRKLFTRPSEGILLNFNLLVCFMFSS